MLSGWRNAPAEIVFVRDRRRTSGTVSRMCTSVAVALKSFHSRKDSIVHGVRNILLASEIPQMCCSTFALRTSESCHEREGARKGRSDRETVPAIPSERSLAGVLGIALTTKGGAFGCAPHFAGCPRRPVTSRFWHCECYRDHSLSGSPRSVSEYSTVER